MKLFVALSALFSVVSVLADPHLRIVKSGVEALGRCDSDECPNDTCSGLGGSVFWNVFGSGKRIYLCEDGDKVYALCWIDTASGLPVGCQRVEI